MALIRCYKNECSLYLVIPIVTFCSDSHLKRQGNEMPHFTTPQKNPNSYSPHTFTYSSAVHTWGPNFYLGNYDNCSDDCPLNIRQVLLTNAFIPLELPYEVTFPSDKHITRGLASSVYLAFAESISTEYNWIEDNKWVYHEENTLEIIFHGLINSCRTSSNSFY